MEITKIADDRYRLESHGHILTVDAQDLLDVFSWLTSTRMQQLREESRRARQTEALPRKEETN